MRTIATGATHFVSSTKSNCASSTTAQPGSQLVAPGAIERADAMSGLVEAHELAAVRNAENAGLCM